MLLPLLALLLTVPLGLWITGDGDFMAGSGSKAVLWGVLAGLTVTALQAARQGTAFAEIMENEPCRRG